MELLTGGRPRVEMSRLKLEAPLSPNRPFFRCQADAYKSPLPPDSTVVHAATNTTHHPVMTREG
jgi:hypothetical protein